MLTIAGIEEVCDRQGITLVMHPVVRRALKRYEESFYVGAYSFLKEGTDGLYFLPLTRGGYLRLVFSKRISSKGHPILRIDPVGADGLARLKAALKEGQV